MYLGKQRKLNRWQEYDYSMPGQYYITICTQNRICHFGEVVDNEMVLNDLGQIVKKQWLWLPGNFAYIKLDEWQIMPNHLHGIIEIIDNPVGTGRDGKIFRDINLKITGNGIPVGNGRDGKIFDETHNVGNVLERSLHNPNNPKILPLYRIIGAFKTTSSKLIHQFQNNLYFQWQKSFHDRVIREGNDLDSIRYYIRQNPTQWAKDKNNPINIKE